jgi:hypothetical protein
MPPFRFSFLRSPAGAYRRSQREVWSPCQPFGILPVIICQTSPPQLSSNAEFIAQTLFDEVAQSVSEAAAANEYKRSLLRRTKTITLVAGEATLSDDVLTHYVADAELLYPSSLTKHYAWRDYPDFVRRGDKRIGIFTIIGGVTLQVVDPNQNFTIPLSATGSRLLTLPCVVLKPATADTAVDAPNEILSDLTEALSNALRGQLSKLAGEAA